MALPDMWPLVRTEWYKIIMRPRSYIGFAAITVLVSIIHIALSADGEAYLGIILQQIEQSFQVEGKIINGNLVAFIILQTLIIQMPLLVALVTGDLLSGEAAAGTIRLLATKPVSRSGLITAKFIVGSIYTFSLVLWLGLLALVAGLLIFGKGDLLIFNSDAVTILRADDTLWRFLVAMIIAFISLTVISALSMMMSAFTDNSIGPIVATMAIVIIFTILSTLELPLFEAISPFLFTSHAIVWREMFRDPVPWDVIGRSLLILTGHIAVFMGITYYYFNRKDILN